MKNKDLDYLRTLIHPSWSDIDDKIDALNDIINECDDQEEREYLSSAIDGYNLVIVNIQKILDKNRKGK